MNHEYEYKRLYDAQFGIRQRAGKVNPKSVTIPEPRSTAFYARLLEQKRRLAKMEEWLLLEQWKAANEENAQIHKLRNLEKIALRVEEFVLRAKYGR